MKQDVHAAMREFNFRAMTPVRDNCLRIGRSFMKLNLLIAGLVACTCVSFIPLQAAAQTADNNPQNTSGVGADAHFAKTLNEQVGSMRLVGKVTIQGGKLPWDPIPVVVNCDGKMVLNTFADRRGEFDIVPAPRESEAAPSKRDPKRPAPSALVGCKVSAVLEGFESTSVIVPNGSIMDSPDLGTIVLRTDPRATGSIVSATTAAASEEAQKEFQKARGDKTDKKLDSAKRHLEKAVSLNPQFAEAWYQLGKLEETDKPQDALSAFQKAAAADPKFIPPYERIASLAASQSKWQAVVDATDRALQLNPAGTPQIWYFNAVGNYNTGKRDVAETSAETSLRMDPSHLAPNTEQLLAVILAARGDYKGALGHLRHCLTYMPAGPNADMMKGQIAQLEKIVPPEK
jgi:tetratricopeptide (TPR) repeat protein